MATAAQNVTVTSARTADDNVAKARSAIQSGWLENGIELTKAGLAVEPKHQDALYILAVAYRLGRNLPKAHTTLDTLIGHYPTYGRAYQERGHAFRDAGRMTEAEAAYKDAVEHNNALLASWRMLSAMHKKAGRIELAKYADAQCAYLDSLPPELQSVASFIQEGRLQKAETLCRAFLQEHKHHPEAMRLLADLGMKFNAYDEAEFLLESCVVLGPANTNAHYDYVEVLNKRQKFGQALDQATLLRQKAPDIPQFEMLYANQNLQVGNFDTALEVYRELIGRNPNNSTIHLTLGHVLKTIGQIPDAVAAYTEAHKLRPDFGDAYWSLANLKTYRFDDEQIASMRAFEDTQTTKTVDRYHLCFALGKALEDKGEYAEAFTYYERGNELKRIESGYDWRQISREMQLQIEHCTFELQAQNLGAGCVAPDPIFIVGLPRAGSTLLEQILASHSQVEGTMELPNILALAHRLDGRRRVDEEARYPANLGEVTRDELTNFGEAYLRDTQIHRKRGTPFFIDKMPNNFRHIGLIHMILPNAKIIDARRGAMGCCFSGFKQLFAEGQEFTYGLEEIGHYYRDYVDLMAYWDALLPGKVLRVNYADVVGDLDRQVRRLLDFIGLPFEDACVNFHETDRAVRTASSEQVRQPIFTSGLDQWEHFAPYLDSLRNALGPELAES